MSPRTHNIIYHSLLFYNQEGTLRPSMSTTSNTNTIKLPTILGEHMMASKRKPSSLEDENKTSDNELTISRKIDVILGECASVTYRARE